MILGLGIDVASKERLRAALERHGESFRERVLTERERLALASRRDADDALAGSWAAKEATVKALGGAAAFAWHDIEIARDEGGRPSLDLRGAARAAADRLGVARAWVSISHDAGVAVAVVVLEGEAPAPPTEERP